MFGMDPNQHQPNGMPAFLNGMLGINPANSGNVQTGIPSSQLAAGNSNGFQQFVAGAPMMQTQGIDQFQQAQMFNQGAYPSGGLVVNNTINVYGGGIANQGTPSMAATPAGSMMGTGISGSVLNTMAQISSMMATVMTGLMSFITQILQSSAERGTQTASTNGTSSVPRTENSSPTEGTSDVGETTGTSNNRTVQTNSDLAEIFTVDKVASILTNTPRANIKKHLPRLLNGFAEQGIDDPDMALYMIATIGVESSGFVPINEFASGEAYEFRSDLGNTEKGDGPRFKGRGFIQLTGRANYRSYGEALGVDLENNPDLANDPDIAARIMARYLKNNEDRLRKGFQNNDLVALRKVVNGGTNGLEDGTHGLGFRTYFNRGLNQGLA